MTAGYQTISFLSDYGLTDEFVGVVKGVIRDLAPHVTVIDVTHQVPPHDVRWGGLALARSIQYLPSGVVLAVVDPGVATERKGVAVEVAEGAGVLVGPDNGLLAPAVSMAGGATRAVVLTSGEHRLASPGPTFDGRDVFAPAAAALCNGVDLAELGDPIDPNLLMPAMMAVSERTDRGISAEVLWVDSFGNAQLNVDPDELDEGDRFSVEVEGAVRTARRVAAFAQLKTGEIGLLVDSYGMLALVMNQTSAAAELGLDDGAGVTLTALGPDDAPAAGRRPGEVVGNPSIRPRRA